MHFNKNNKSNRQSHCKISDLKAGSRAEKAQRHESTINSNTSLMRAFNINTQLFLLSTGVHKAIDNRKNEIEDDRWQILLTLSCALASTPTSAQHIGWMKSWVHLRATARKLLVQTSKHCRMVHTCPKLCKHVPINEHASGMSFSAEASGHIQYLVWICCGSRFWTTVLMSCKKYAFAKCQQMRSCWKSRGACERRMMYHMMIMTETAT